MNKKLLIENFKELDGFAEKSINKLLSSINNSKRIKLSNFLYALGIKEIGLETSKNLLIEIILTRDLLPSLSRDVNTRLVHCSKCRCI